MAGAAGGAAAGSFLGPWGALIGGLVGSVALPTSHTEAGRAVGSSGAQTAAGAGLGFLGLGIPGAIMGAPIGLAKGVADYFGLQLPGVGGGRPAASAPIPPPGKFQHGGDVSHDMLGMLHAREMVLDPTIADWVRKAAQAFTSPPAPAGSGSYNGWIQQITRWLAGGASNPPFVRVVGFDPNKQWFGTEGGVGAGNLNAPGGRPAGRMGGMGPGAKQAADEIYHAPQGGYGKAGLPASGDPRGLEGMIRAAAIRHGVDPEVALAVARSEGLKTFAGDHGTSHGAYQIHTGGGLGDNFRRQTGLDPSNRQNEPATIDWAIDYASKHGWEAFHGARHVGIGPKQGIGKSPPVINQPPGAPVQGYNPAAHGFPNFPGGYGFPTTYGGTQKPIQMADKPIPAFDWNQRWNPANPGGGALPPGVYRNAEGGRYAGGLKLITPEIQQQIDAAPKAPSLHKHEPYPQYQFGGLVPSSGLAMLHLGERVLSSSQNSMFSRVLGGLHSAVLGGGPATVFNSMGPRSNSFSQVNNFHHHDNDRAAAASMFRIIGSGAGEIFRQAKPAID